MDDPDITIEEYIQLEEEKARRGEFPAIVYKDALTSDPKILSRPTNQATVQDGRVVVQNVQGRQNRGHGNNARRTGAAGYRGAQNRVRNENLGQARQIKCYNCNDRMSES
nr:hypothetical protein [Tanacetum cinerariifolium]